MKSILFISGILVSSFLGSCQKNEKTHEHPATQTEVTQEIIRDTVTNQQGMVLVMTFNNKKRTATLVWQGKTIELKQDSMASGMKYSNPTYELTEHQGTLTLKKRGNTVFSYKK
jgi:membrane-bound inhibitor of C-type lysozyme